MKRSIGSACTCNTHVAAIKMCSYSVVFLIDFYKTGCKIVIIEEITQVCRRRVEAFSTLLCPCHVLFIPQTQSLAATCLIVLK